MNDELSLLADVADRLFADARNDGATQEYDLDDGPGRTWRQIENAGLALLGIPENLGGSGGGVRELAVVLNRAGYHALAQPLCDHQLAAWLCSQVGVEPPEGILSYGIVDGAGGYRVPWGRSADQVAVVDPSKDSLTIVGPEFSSIDLGGNLAGEPRDRIAYDTSGISSTQLTPSIWDRFQHRTALATAILMDGAAQRVLDLAAGYAQEREQFGKPINRFQAIQHYLAEIAGECRLLHALIATAVEAAEEAGTETLLVVAAAKARAGQVATIVTRLGHQIHGTIGYTAEYPLGLYTRRLLAWRDEAGSQQAWEQFLGQRARAMGAVALWDELSLSPVAGANP